MTLRRWPNTVIFRPPLYTRAHTTT